jgi:hypothetical protein
MTKWNELPTDQLREMVANPSTTLELRGKVVREILDREHALDDLHDAMINYDWSK